MALGARYAPGRRGRRLRNTVNELLGDQAEGRCPGLPEPYTMKRDGPMRGSPTASTQAGSARANYRSLPTPARAHPDGGNRCHKIGRASWRETAWTSEVA